jgi:cell division septum initiation protein DivIVA
MLEARSIREDATEEVAKLMATLNTERDHILADARDDARRILEDARESSASDDDLE